MRCNVTRKGEDVGDFEDAVDEDVADGHEKSQRGGEGGEEPEAGSGLGAEAFGEEVPDTGDDGDEEGGVGDEVGPVVGDGGPVAVGEAEEHGEGGHDDRHDELAADPGPEDADGDGSEEVLGEEEGSGFCGVVEIEELAGIEREEEGVVAIDDGIGCCEEDDADAESREQDQRVAQHAAAEDERRGEASVGPEAVVRVGVFGGEGEGAGEEKEEDGRDVEGVFFQVSEEGLVDLVGSEYGLDDGGDRDDGRCDEEGVLFAEVEPAEVFPGGGFERGRVGGDGDGFGGARCSREAKTGKEFEELGAVVEDGSRHHERK